MLFSIIIPTFNGGNRISECIDSIYSQDLDINDFEVICIDDASTDNSYEKIKEYTIKYDNLYIYKNSINKCSGGSRNEGIFKAKGEYILFIDDDDTFIKKSLFKIKELLIKDKTVDILMFDYKNFFEDREFLHYGNNKSKIMSGIEYLRENEPTIFPWCGVYKRSFIKKNNLFFAENVYFEDTDWIFKCITKSRKIIYCPIFVYLWKQNPTSCSNINYSRNNRKIKDSIKLCSRIYELYEEVKIIDYAASEKIRIYTIMLFRQFLPYLIYYKGYRNKIELLSNLQKIRSKVFPVYLSFITIFPKLSAVLIHIFSPFCRLYFKLKNK